MARVWILWVQSCRRPACLVSFLPSNHPFVSLRAIVVRVTAIPERTRIEPFLWTIVPGSRNDLEEKAMAQTHWNGLAHIGLTFLTPGWTLPINGVQPAASVYRPSPLSACVLGVRWRASVGKLSVPLSTPEPRPHGSFARESADPEFPRRDSRGTTHFDPTMC